MNRASAKCKHASERCNETQVRCAVCGVFLRRIDDRLVTRIGRVGGAEAPLAEYGSSPIEASAASLAGLLGLMAAQANGAIRSAMRIPRWPPLLLLAFSFLLSPFSLLLAQSNGPGTAQAAAARARADTDVRPSPAALFARSLPPIRLSGVAADSKLRAAVRVNTSDRDGTRSHGTGTVIEAYDDATGCVATNHHVIKDTDGLVVVQFPGGDWSTAVILEVDAAADVALLWVSLSAGQVVCPPAQHDPPIGAPVTIAGYGADCLLTAQHGRAAKYTAPMPVAFLEVQPCMSRDGDSGGPMFVAGELGGVLFGSAAYRGERYTNGAPCGIVRRLLGRFRQRRLERLRRRGQRIESRVKQAEQHPRGPWRGVGPGGPNAQAPPTFSDGSGPQPIVSPPAPEIERAAIPAATPSLFPPPAAAADTRAQDEARRLRAENARLNQRLADQAQEAPSRARSEEPAGDGAHAAQTAAPGFFARLASFAAPAIPSTLTALGLGGPAAAAGYLAARLLARRVAKRSTAHARPSPAQAPTHEIKFVDAPQQSAELTSLLQAIEVLGAQSPAGRKFALDLQSYKNQLMTRAAQS